MHPTICPPRPFRIRSSLSYTTRRGRCCWRPCHVKSAHRHTTLAVYLANGCAAASLIMAGSWNRPIFGRIRNRQAKPSPATFRSTIRSAGPKPGGKTQLRLSGKAAVLSDPADRTDQFPDRCFAITVLIQVAKRIRNDRLKGRHIEYPDAEYPLFEPADYVHTMLSTRGYLNPSRPIDRTPTLDFSGSKFTLGLPKFPETAAIRPDPPPIRRPDPPPGDGQHRKCR